MLRLLSLLTILLLLALPVTAKQHKKQKKNIDVSVSGLVAEGQFSAAEKHIIRNGIFQNENRKQKPLPQGVEKQQARGKGLPPGWQKKVVQGKRLDFHVYRNSAPLPGNVLDRLPPAPAGMELIRIGDDILRLQTGTHIVLDRFQLLKK